METDKTGAFGPLAFLYSSLAAFPPRSGPEAMTNLLGMSESFPKLLAVAGSLIGSMAPFSEKGSKFTRRRQRTNSSA